MTWRRQLPAYSPLPLKAVLAGVAGLLTGAKAARLSVAASLRQVFEAEDVLLTDSGTGALTLAIRACLADRPGTAVALPAYGCYDLATAANGAGAPVVLYDVAPETLAADLGSLDRALRHRVGAVVLAHWYGVPVDPEPFRAAAERAGALLIEDAAQGAGASLRGRPLGSFGDLVVLSFGRGKGITAGRGGALLGRGERGARLLERARSGVGAPRRGLREMVQLKAQWLLGRPMLYAIPSSLAFLRLGETVYRPPVPPRAMSDVAARTLAVTQALSDRETAVRRANAMRLLERRGAGLTLVRVPADAEPGYLRLPFVATPAARTAAASTEARAVGIMPGYPKALSELEGFGERVVNRGDAFHGAQLLARQLVTIPAHSRLSGRDVERLGVWISDHSGERSGAC